MTRTTLIAPFIFAICAGNAAQAEDFVVGSLKISTPWVRAMPGGAAIGGGYMTITNNGGSSDRLVGILRWSPLERRPAAARLCLTVRGCNMAVDRVPS